MFLTPGYFITSSLIFTVVTVIKLWKPINERLRLRAIKYLQWKGYIHLVSWITTPIVSRFFFIIYRDGLAWEVELTMWAKTVVVAYTDRWWQKRIDLIADLEKGIQLFHDLWLYIHKSKFSIFQVAPKQNF